MVLPREWLLKELGGPEPIGAGADYTVAQVASMFGKKPVTIRKWLAAGELKGAYLLHGKEWRIPPAAVQMFQEKARGTPGAEDLGAWRKSTGRAAGSGR